MASSIELDTKDPYNIASQGKKPCDSDMEGPYELPPDWLDSTS